MQATHAPPETPGISVSELWTQVPLLTLPLLIGMAIVMLSHPFRPGRTAGHLPWPVLQWAFSSPMGMVMLMAVATLIITAPFIVLQRRTWPRYLLTYATDVTGIPLERWPRRSHADARTRAERWLGREPHQRRVSLLMLALACVFTLALLAVFVAAAIFSFPQNATLRCGEHGCAPWYPIVSIVAIGEMAAIGLSCWAVSRRTRQVEILAGIWLRYRSSFQIQSVVYYVRWPGVTVETAHSALARFTPHGAMPRARVLLLTVLAMTPMALLFSMAIFLSAWLQTQWIPG